MKEERDSLSARVGARTACVPPREQNRGLRAKWEREAAREKRPPAWHTVCHTGGKKLVTQRRVTATWSPGEGRGGGDRAPRAPSIVQVGIRRERRRPFIHRVAGEEGRSAVILAHSRTAAAAAAAPNARCIVQTLPRRSSGWSMAAAAVLEVVAMVTGCFLRMFLCPLSIRGGAGQVRLGPTGLKCQDAERSASLTPAVQPRGCWLAIRPRNVLLLCHQLFSR